MKKPIPLSVPNFRGKELEYVTKAVETEWVSTGGAYIDEFEKNIAKYVGARGAVACQSGTSGLHLALKVLGIDETMEVIVPTLTFIAAVNPVTYVNATPVFMDCDDTLCMDIDKLQSFIEHECDFVNNQLIDRLSKKHVACVIIVHVFGNIAYMERLMELAERYHLKVIEDSTEALGSKLLQGKFSNQYAGTIGDIGVYSFNGNKIISTGGGGMIVSNNEQYLKHAKYLSTQAKDDALYFIHNNIGYNYRMTNLQAGLGLAQLAQLDEFIAIKNLNYDEYQKNGIGLLSFRDDILSNKWFYSHMMQNATERDALIKHLMEKDVQSRPIWSLIHSLPPYCGCRSYQIEKAQYYQSRIVNLPCSTSLKKEDVRCVSEVIHEYELR